MNNRFFKQSVLTVAALIGITSVAVQAQVLTFNSVTGFSDTQGANGWSYAGVHFPGVNNLLANAVLGTYNPAGPSYDVFIPAVGAVALTATSQNYQPGNAIFSLRYWTADQNYSTVSLSSTLEATITLGAFIIFADAATNTQTQLGGAFATAGGIAAGGGTEVLSISGVVNNVVAGDRIYFMMQNAGEPQDSSIQQNWNQTVTATVPEPSTVALMAVGAGLGLWRLRKSMRVAQA